MKENKIIMTLLFTATLMLGIFVAILVPEGEVKEILVTLAQLNVTIAVGVGALSIGYAQDRKVQSKLTESTIVIVLFSLLTFLLANVDTFLFMKKIYLVINIFAMCLALLYTLIVTQKDKK